MGLDRALIEADGTPNKGKLGANAILGVSLAAAKAAAAAHGLPLYRYLGGANARVLPVPMANIINGGKHADNKIDFQEFMVMPVGAKSFREAIRTVAEVFHHLKSVLKKAGHNTNVGDEGGFAPNLDNEEAIKFILDAVDKAGYQAGRDKDIAIALDTACSELFEEGQKKGYKFWKSAPEKIYSSEQMIELFASWVEKYPMIVSIEDPLDQDDWAGYAALTKSLGNKVQIVGDDFYVTNTERLAKGIKEACTNSILIKVNQIGTLTETLEAVEMANACRLDERDVSSFGRNRRHNHRGHRRRDQLRPDQDRQSEPVRPHCQVQPASPDRRTTGIERRVRCQRAQAGLKTHGDCVQARGVPGAQSRGIHRSARAIHARGASTDGGGRDRSGNARARGRDRDRSLSRPAGGRFEGDHGFSLLHLPFRPGCRREMATPGDRSRADQTNP